MKQKINYSLMGKVLSNSASTNELHEFKQWLNLSEENRNTFDEAKQIWENFNSVHSDKEFDHARAKKLTAIKIAKNKSIKQTRKVVRFYISTAASILVLFGLFQFFITNNTDNLASYTSNYATEKIILEDSTVVWLNKNSSLKIGNRFNKNKRRVYLTGEGYFEVKRNQNKPFEVIAGHTFTKVLGTSFNILENTTGNNTSIIVNSGKVAFKKHRGLGKATILTKNNKATYNAISNTIEKELNKNLNYLSWKSNYLIFNDTPLSDVCQQLSKHFNTKITNSSNDSNLYMTGKYEGESLSEILQIIEITFNIRVDSSANEYSLHDARMN